MTFSLRSRKYLLRVCLGLCWMVFLVRGQSLSAQPVGLEDQDFVRKRIEGLPPVQKPGVKLPPPDLEFPSESLQYEDADPGFRPELTPPSIQAAPVPRPKWPRLFTNYIRAGFGRFVTPVVQLHAANGMQGREPRYAWQVDYHHLSTPRGHTDEARFAENYGLIKGRYFLDEHSIAGHLRFRHDLQNFYGDSSIVRLEDIPDSIRQRYTRFEFQAAISRNHHPDVFNYNIPLRIRTYGEKTGNSEFHFSVLPSLNYRFNELLGVGAETRLTYSNFTHQLTDESEGRFFLSLAPYATVNYSPLKLSGEAGLRFGTFSADTSITRVFPHVKARFHPLPDSALAIFAQATGGIHYQQRYELVDRNPFLAPLAFVLPSVENIHLALGGEGRLGRVFWRVKGYYRSVDLQPVFFSTPTDSLTPELPATGTQGRFQILYEEDFNETGAEIELQYDWEEKVRADLLLKFASFGLDQLTEYYHVPAFEARIGGSYFFAEKVLARTGLHFIGERPLGLTPTGETLTGDPFFDLTLGAEYFFSRRFSVWAEGTNLLNMDYIRWNGYIERGLDFKIGGTFSF